MQQLCLFRQLMKMFLRAVVVDEATTPYKMIKLILKRKKISSRMTLLSSLRQLKHFWHHQKQVQRVLLSYAEKHSFEAAKKCLHASMFLFVHYKFHRIWFKKKADAITMFTKVTDNFYENQRLALIYSFPMHPFSTPHWERMG